MPSHVSTTPEPFAPAGWYRDPLGLPQLRWWNGMMWTNQIEDPHPEVQVATGYRVELVGAP
jgi:hypothetical protein